MIKVGLHGRSQLIRGKTLPTVTAVSTGGPFAASQGPTRPNPLTEDAPLLRAHWAPCSCCLTLCKPPRGLRHPHRCGTLQYGATKLALLLPPACKSYYNLLNNKLDNWAPRVMDQQGHASSEQQQWRHGQRKLHPGVLACTVTQSCIVRRVGGGHKSNRISWNGELERCPRTASATAPAISVSAPQLSTGHVEIPLCSW